MDYSRAEVWSLEKAMVRERGGFPLLPFPSVDCGAMMQRVCADERNESFSWPNVKSNRTGGEGGRRREVRRQLLGLSV